MIVTVRMKNVIPRGETYCFRMRVPSDCVASLGKTEITQSLKTKNPLEAQKAADLLKEKWTAKFEAIRKPATPASVAVNSPALIAEEFRQTLLGRVDQGMAEIFARESDAKLRERLEGYGEFMEQLRQNQRCGLDLSEIGIKWPLESSGNQQVDRLRRKALIDVIRVMRDAVDEALGDQGEVTPVEKPSPKTQSEPSGSPITLFLTVPKRRLFLIVFIAFACGFAGPSHAASDKWALLIGVDKCEAVGELKVCSADALALKSVLQQIGYPDNHITVLVDNNQSNINATPTIGNVERAIKRLAQVAKADDKIFFFFSGHGVTHDGTSFLVPTDGDLTRGVSLTWIKDQFAACKAREKVMILDACHSGAAKGVSGITPDLKTVGNLVMLLSCEKDQVSWPDKQGRHSVFTSAILEGLSGKAANADRKVTHQTLADYVYDSVRDWTYENQKNEQTPVLVADTSGDIVLADIALMKPSVTSNVDGGALAGVAIPSGMVRIPGGSNSGTDPDFGAYSLTVSTFYMDRTEVTKAQWDIVYSWASTNGYSFDNAGLGNTTNHPVQTVNWYDCVKWCNARSQMEGKTPCYTVSGGIYKTGQSSPDCNVSVNGYRLPTNTEWSYATRGGLSNKRFPWGDTITHSDANYRSEASCSYDISPTRGYNLAYTKGGKTHTSPAGSFPANGYGLYDMAGDVWEWCWDSSGSDRSLRGGSWNHGADQARCGDAYWHDPSIAHIGVGLRSVCR